MQISFSSEWPVLLVFATALVLLAFTVWSYRKVRDAKVAPKVFWTVAGLRIAAIVALLLLLLQPLVRSSRQITQRGIVAVLLDASDSMSIADGAKGAKRLDEAVGLLGEQGRLLAELQARFDTRLFRFGAQLTSLDRKQLVPTLKLDDETQIGKALQETLNGLRRWEERRVGREGR